LNDYSVTNVPAIREAYRAAVAPDYYLPRVVSDQRDLPAYQQPLTAGSTLTGTVRVSAWAKSYDDELTLVYALDGKEIARVKMPGDGGIALDTTRYPTGTHTLSLTVLDARGKQAGQKAVPVVFRR